jgi:two-component system chemotaxis response regulator CheB
MPKRDIVVIGASAGGVEALRELVAGLPSDFPASVLIVLHVPATGRSALPKILERAGRLPVKQAEDDDPIEPGRVLVAPPDRHLVVYGNRILLSPGPRENGHRPAVDVLFRSASRLFGPRVTAVVLSGTLDDGAAGMATVRRRGGRGIAQDPDDALHAGMPRAAIVTAGPEYVLPVADIPRALTRIVTEAVEDSPGQEPALLAKEDAMARFDVNEFNDPDRPGDPSGLSCPDCHGVLFEIHEGRLSRYRCRIGHGWSMASLVAEQSSSLETALWISLRTLHEKSALSSRLAARARDVGHELSAHSFQMQAESARGAAQVVHDLIVEISSSQLAPSHLPDEGADPSAALEIAAGVTDEAV